jgi:DNA polymerase (family X)
MARKKIDPAPLGKVSNEEIARAFDEVADLLDLENDNPFRIRAYRNAARTLRAASEEVADMVARGGDPDDLPGIGKDLAAQIVEMITSGRLSRLDRLRPEVPALAIALSHIPDVGFERHALSHGESRRRAAEHRLRRARHRRFRQSGLRGRTSASRLVGGGGYRQYACCQRAESPHRGFAMKGRRDRK